MAVQVDQRIPGIAPTGEKGDDGYNNEDGPRLREDNMPPDTQIATTIDARGVIQLTRQPHEELAEEENIIRGAKDLRHHNGQDSVDPAKIFEGDIKGNGEHL